MYVLGTRGNPEKGFRSLMQNDGKSRICVVWFERFPMCREVLGGMCGGGIYGLLLINWFRGSDKRQDTKTQIDNGERERDRKAKGGGVVSYRLGIFCVWRLE